MQKTNTILLHFVLLLSFAFFGTSYSYGQNKITGTIVDFKTGDPLILTSVQIENTELGTCSDSEGKFTLSLPEQGKYNLLFYYVGYQRESLDVDLNKEEVFITVKLKELSLDLDEVVVTATQNKDNITSSYKINRDAIEHAQVNSISELTSLLPGGQTITGNLVENDNKRISVRSEHSEAGSPSFGTAIEVDGIRLSNNANFEETKGFDARIISSENIEKVEIITGIPSVEHGDLTEGLMIIKTKQGKTPLNIDFSLNPKQKSASISKGFQPGKNTGVFNFSYNFTRSIKEIASPFNSYERNSFSTLYKKVFFDKTKKPLIITSNISGNFGGSNSSADPDQFLDTYEKTNAFNIRGGFDLKWNVNALIISKIDISANVNYSDNIFEDYSNFSSASGELAFHGIEEGYFVADTYQEGKPLSPIQLLDRGYWFQTKYIDSKPINYSANIKLDKILKKKHITNNIKIGANFTGSGNRGKGLYYGNMAYIPTWREQRFDQEPYLNNLAIYAEETFKYKSSKNKLLQLIIGFRNDYSFVKDAKYNNVSALSPRISIKYDLINNANSDYFSNLNCYAGWGKSVKLPSFNMLYIRPTYSQKKAFVPGSLNDGTTYYAYYIQPDKVTENKSLRWQQSRKIETGIQGKFRGINFSIAYFNTLGTHQYDKTFEYIPFTYYLTTPHQLSEVTIPHENRTYAISPTGTVTVFDDRGILPQVELEKNEKRSFIEISYADNGSPVRRHGIEWVIDFGKFKPIQTSLRLDGKYYFYRYLDTEIEAKWLGDNYLMSSGQHYQYIGYYYGGDNIANGEETRKLTTNATLITHIPKLKLIVSLRIEGTFVNTSQALAEMPGGERTFELDKKEGYIPKDDRGSIYEGNNFTGMYPIYYTSFDDLETKIPFWEKYIWAFENDRTLFNDLTKMVVTSSRDYKFAKFGISPYFTSNINVSKEISKKIKLTFYAKNFLNNMAMITHNENKQSESLLNSIIITPFSYGMSLKIKI